MEIWKERKKSKKGGACFVVYYAAVGYFSGQFKN